MADSDLPSGRYDPGFSGYCTEFTGFDACVLLCIL